MGAKCCSCPPKTISNQRVLLLFAEHDSIITSLALRSTTYQVSEYHLFRSRSWWVRKDSISRNIVVSEPTSARAVQECSVAKDTSVRPDYGKGGSLWVFIAESACLRSDLSSRDKGWTKSAPIWTQLKGSLVVIVASFCIAASTPSLPTAQPAATNGLDYLYIDHSKYICKWAMAWFFADCESGSVWQYNMQHI